MMKLLITKWAVMLVVMKPFANDLLLDYRQKNQTKKSSNILYYCTNSKKNASEDISAKTSLPVELECSNENLLDTPSTSSSIPQSVRATPAQDKLKTQISLLQMECDLVVRRRDSLGAIESETRDVTKLRRQIDKCKTELRRKEQHMRHSQSHRLSMKSKIKLACNQSPIVANLLKARSAPGRPRLEEQQTELLITIVDLAMFGASAEERRRSDLHEKLKEHGFQISKSGTYLRLLPRNYTTLEGKRHVVTVPVKLSHDVVAEYVEPDDKAESFVPDLPSPQWYSEHVRESQYLLQVLKCDDRACCGHVRSSLRSILPERFMIPPYPILQSSSGLCIPKPEEHDGKTFATFLLRLSLGISKSLQKDRQQLLERTCQWCGLYFCTKKKVKEHVNSCHKQCKNINNSVGMHNVHPSRILTRRSNGRSREILCVVRENDDTEWLDESDVDFQQNTVPTTDLQDAYPVVSVEESLANPWSEDNISSLHSIK